MPETPPVSKADTALASSTSGALIVAQGPGAAPATPTSLTYTDGGAGSRVFAITEGMTRHAHPTIDTTGASCFSFDPSVSPAWQLGGSLLYDQGQSGRPHFVVAQGMNLFGSNQQIDPTQTMSRYAIEYNYWNSNGVGAGPEYTHEFHLPAILPPASTGLGEHRPLSILYGDASHKAIANFAVSALSITDETGLQSKGGYSFDGTTMAFTILYNHGTGPAGTVFSYSASATSDVFAFGRGSVPTTSILNGSQFAEQISLGGVLKYSRGVDSGNGGQYTLTGPSGATLETSWTLGGVSKKWYSERLIVGGFGAATAQVQVIPDAVGTIGFISRALAGQTVSTLECQDSSGNPILAVGPSSGVTIGGGTPVKKILSATATLDFPSTAAGSTSDLTISLTGALTTDQVILECPSLPASLTRFVHKIQSADVVTVRFYNDTASAVDPASGTYRATILRF